MRNDYGPHVLANENTLFQSQEFEIRLPVLSNNGGRYVWEICLEKSYEITFSSFNQENLLVN